MIVGDPLQIRIKDDNLFIKTEKKWIYDGDEIKARIRVRQRMIGAGNSLIRLGVPDGI
jgi:hypothetical protein